MTPCTRQYIYTMRFSKTCNSISEPVEYACFVLKWISSTISRLPYQIYIWLENVVWSNVESIRTRVISLDRHPAIAKAILSWASNKGCDFCTVTGDSLPASTPDSSCSMRSSFVRESALSRSFRYVEEEAFIFPN